MSFGTNSSRNGDGGPYWQLLQTSEVEGLPWAQEIEGKVNVFNKPVHEFLDVFVPGRGPPKPPSKKVLNNAFKKTGAKGKKVDQSSILVRLPVRMA